MSLIETSADPVDRAQDKVQRYNETCIEQQRAGRRIRDFIIFYRDSETSREERHTGTNATLLEYLEDELHISLTDTPWAAGYLDDESHRWVVNDRSTNDGLKEMVITRPVS